MESANPNDRIDLLIVGRTGFKIFPYIYAVSIDYRDHLVQQLTNEKDIIINHTNYFISLHDTVSETDYILHFYRQGEHDQKPPSIFKDIVYRMLSTHPQLMSPRVVRYAMDLLRKMLRICSPVQPLRQYYKAVTYSYLNDLILKIVKDPVSTQDLVSQSNIHASEQNLSSVSSLNESYQNYLYELHERLKKRFILSGIASVASIATQQLCIPVIDEIPVIELLSPFAQDTKYSESDQNNTAFNIQISLIQDQIGIPFQNVYIQNPFQVIADMKKDKEHHETAVIEAFLKLPNKEVFMIFRQSVDRSLQHKLSSGKNIYDSIAYSSLQSESADYQKQQTLPYDDHNIMITRMIALLSNTFDQFVK